MLFRRSAVVLLLLGGGITPIALATEAACAASPNHAALIIDTGSRVERVCVAFDEESVKGKAVLDRANVGVVYQQQPYGHAVCSILGVGNPPSDCLNAQHHWSYFRAAKGTAAWTYSNRGVDDTTVRDGDLEGWKWEGGTPPFAPASEICPPPPPPPTSPPPAAPPTTSGGVGGNGRTAPHSTDTSVKSGVAAPAGATATTAAPPIASTIPGETTTTDAPPGPLRILEPDEPNGGSPWALGAVGAIIAGIGVATWRISRRRAAGG